MGGIAGIFHCGTVKPIDPARVGRMCDALAHRGPDGSGVWTAPGVGLGQRRFATIDPAGPLPAADGRAVLVFDGEIDNARELRRELRDLGAGVRGDGVGEVILAAWQRWGVACLSRFEGTFALAIYDVEARTLFLARDRLGVKPLVLVHLSDGSLAFASELKGLLAHPLLRRDVDLLAIEDYLAWGYVPDHRSILKGVEKLAAGHYRLLRHGAKPAAPQRWWDMSFAERRRGTERDLEAELLHHLRLAVTSRMDADAPPGALLSGDADSSSVVALMAEASRSPVKTCSIGFAGTPAETALAAKVAALLGTDHVARQVAGAEVAALDALAALFDEPFADPAALSAWRACQLARERVAAVLCGDGADEVFAGHRRQASQHREERFRALLPAGIRRDVLGPLGQAVPRASWAPGLARAGTTLQALAGRAGEGYARALSVVPPALRGSLYAPDLVRELGEYRAEQPLLSLMQAAPARSGLDRAQYADLAFGLPGATLTRLDRTGMAAGLQVRAPLLDHRLVEFAASLPERLRVRGGHGKWLLRKALRRYLPDEVLRRPGPGPATPVAAWLRGPLAGEVRSIAASAALARTGWFDNAQILRLAEAHRAGRSDHSRLLWQLLMLDRSLIKLGLIS